jgi:hypothetical protein
MPTAQERLRDIRLKVKWADKHLVNLQIAISDFLGKRPYKVRADVDPKFRQPTYYIDSVRRTPFEIAALTGDVIQNLRSALDHLAWSLVEIGQHSLPAPLTAGERKRVGFPIVDTDDPTEYETQRRRKVKGMRNNAIKKIDAIKPYKGGDKTLWELNQLNNVDKHRFLLTAGLAVRAISADSIFPDGMLRVFPGGGGTITWDRINPGNILLVPEKPIFPLVEGTKLFVDVADAEVNENDKFRFSIAFSEAGIIEGKSVLPTLLEFRNYVNNVILSFRDDLA